MRLVAGVGREGRGAARAEGDSTSLPHQAVQLNPYSLRSHLLVQKLVQVRQSVEAAGLLREGVHSISNRMAIAYKRF